MPAKAEPVLAPPPKRTILEMEETKHHNRKTLAGAPAEFRRQFIEAHVKCGRDGQVMLMSALDSKKRFVPVMCPVCGLVELKLNQG